MKIQKRLLFIVTILSLTLLISCKSSSQTEYFPEDFTVDTIHVPFTAISYESTYGEVLDSFDNALIEVNEDDVATSLGNKYIYVNDQSYENINGFLSISIDLDTDTISSINFYSDELTNIATCDKYIKEICRNYSEFYNSSDVAEGMFIIDDLFIWVHRNPDSTILCIETKKLHEDEINYY